MSFQRINEVWFLTALTVVNLVARLFRINDPSFLYFDEKAFYIPAAKQILTNGVDPVFEHPPLAKLLFATSLKIFGDNPIGWRFFPIVASVISVLLVYLLTKKLFGRKDIALLSSVLFSLDFAWFTSGRLAFPEAIFATILLASVVMFIYFLKETDNKRNWINLVVASTIFGLTLATKWSALLVMPIFIFAIAYKYKSNLKALGLSMATFLILVVSVYLAGFGFYIAKNGPVALIKLHQEMYSYHSKTVDEIVEKNQKLKIQEGQYKAIFWPLNNVFSYRFEESGGTVKSVLLFYNPAILWGALVVVGLSIFAFIRKKKLDNKSLLLISLFLVFWLPFIFSPRIVYPYYWIAGIPFGTIVLAKFLIDRNKKNNQLIIGYLATTLTLFVLYYPLLTNMPVKIIYFRILTGTIGFN